MHMQVQYLYLDANDVMHVKNSFTYSASLETHVCFIDI